MRAAAVQLGSSLDKAQNRRALERAVRAVTELGAELVVLPEAVMSGFGSKETDLSAAAEALDGPFVATLAGLSGSTGATVVAGMFEAVPGERRVYNTVVVTSDGSLVGRYRKLHLYDALGWVESERVVPGDPGDDGILVVAVGELTVGVMTCYDLRFPEMARALVDAGADTLAVPAAWVAGTRKVEQWRALLAARAIESTAYVVAAAQPGPEYSGHTTIIDPSGAVLAELDAKADAAAPPAPAPTGPPPWLAQADVVPSEVAAVRAQMPVLANRRFSVVAGGAAGATTPTR
ncbi:MAG TPA: carbon-nitrogen hydrolase family protein [Acidimicrobiales bacterium]|nr:carbon-nitrogen hydrolase family protein [Acidimicrobiales bacterium]